MVSVPILFCNYVLSMPFINLVFFRGNIPGYIRKEKNIMKLYSLCFHNEESNLRVRLTKHT